MTTIIDLSNEKIRVLNELLSLDEEDEFARVLQSHIDGLTHDIEGKLNYLSDIYIELKYLALAREQAKKDADKRHKSAIGTATRLKGFITYIMDTHDIQKLEASNCIATKVEGRMSVHVDEDVDLSKLPKSLVIEVPKSYKINKTAVKDALALGEEIKGKKGKKIKGIRMVQGAPYLLIR